MLDYLNSESEEVKTALTQLSEAKQALKQARDHYCPSILDERYLTGEEVCRYLHISPRTLQTLRDTRQIPLPLSAGGYFSIPRAEYGKSFTEIYSLSKNRFNLTNGACTAKPGRIGLNIPCVPALLLTLLSFIYSLGTYSDQIEYYTSAIPHQ